MIGRAHHVIIDCPDPQALAAFYGEILGMRVNEDTDGAWQKDPAAPTARKLAAGPCRGTDPPELRLAARRRLPYAGTAPS